MADQGGREPFLKEKEGVHGRVAGCHYLAKEDENKSAFLLYMLAHRTCTKYCHVSNIHIIE